jgi:hypothetical protein
MPIAKLKPGDRPEAVVRYGYRSFDRQWIIADARLADRPRPQLWASHSDRQIYLTTLTSTKLGAGPVVNATPYVPDLHHFRGSYGAKDVMPLYRDAKGREPNVTDGLCEALTDLLGINVGPLELTAYVYALTSTPAFAEHFEGELGEGAGPVRVPVTAEGDLFEDAVKLGRELLWLHTWGERFRPEGEEFPVGTAVLTRPLSGYPNDFTYIDAGARLLVGDGVIEPVSREVWEFEVSGLKIVRSWLGYRMADRKGRKSSPLDEIRPSKWTFTEELRTLLAVLEQTLLLTPAAGDLLAGIVDGPLIDASSLPTPTDHQPKPPRTL